MLQFDNNETNEVLKNWIHKEYGVKSGLHSFEYNIVYDERMDDDVQIAAGPCILIVLKYPPWHTKFKPMLRHIFNDLDLKRLRRSKAMVRASDAAKWYSLSESNALSKVETKRINVHSYTVTYITKVKVTDKKTKRSVTVEVEGSAFEAVDEGCRILYGSRLD